MKHIPILQAVSVVTAIGLLAACCPKDTSNPDPQTRETATPKTPTSEPAIPAPARDLTGLDVLTDYDRDMWSGPDGWSDAQWRWKKRLKWDQDCDYVGEVKTADISPQLQLVTVQCVPGSYQPMSYLYLYDTAQQKSKTLELGLADTSEKPQDIWGRISYNADEKTLSILSLSRGLADCGTYRKFQLSNTESLKDVELVLDITRGRGCEDHGGIDFEKLPKAIFDYKNWPAVE